MTGPADIVELHPGLTAQVVSLDDLMMDRVVQATDGTPATFGDAVKLAVGAYAQIDWDGLEQRAQEASGTMDEAAAIVLPESLAKIRRMAIREFRKARIEDQKNQDSRNP